MVATWLASQPTVPDFSCGFQFHFSSGHRSKTLRVFCISWSNSPSIICPIVMTSSLAAIEIPAYPILGEQKANCQAFLSTTRESLIGPANSVLLSCASTQIGHFEFTLVFAVVLTVRGNGRKWRYGTPTHHLLLERFHRSLPVLQETCRASHGAVPGQGAFHDPRRRIQLHRHPRETHGGKYALALERFSNQRRREAGPQSRHRVRRTAQDAWGIAGTVGTRLEVCIRRIAAAHRRRCNPDSNHPQRTAFGNAGHQPAGRALHAPHWPDPFFGQAFDREVYGKMANAERPARAVKTVHC